MEPNTPNSGTRQNQGFEPLGIHERPAAASLMEQGKDIVQQGKEKTSDLLEQAKCKASETIDTVRQGYSQLGERLQEGGEYVRERASEGADQVTRLIRRNPTAALAISFFAGFFICRMFKD